jgi:hypothetical protein
MANHRVESDAADRASHPTIESEEQGNDPIYASRQAESEHPIAIVQFGAQHREDHPRGSGLAGTQRENSRFSPKGGCGTPDETEMTTLAKRTKSTTKNCFQNRVFLQAR